MISWVRKSRLLTALCLVFMLVISMNAWASSDDNSLAGLGITTEGATVSPEFSYDIWEYNVTVPAGTTELTLDPTPSSDLASITDITGTALAEDGTATVLITVTSGSGAPFTYTLHVTAEAPVQTEAQTEAKQTEAETQAPETEPQTEDGQYVRVDKNTIQEAENTITDLKSDIVGYRETVSLYTKIIYGLIALSVVLLFLVINLALKKRDLKAEIRDLEEGAMTGAPAPARRPQQMPPQGGQPQPRVRVEKAPKGQQAPAKPARKPKVMPQYEQEKPAQQPKPAPAPQKEQAPEKTEPKRQPEGKKEKKDVHIDMIDL